MLVLPTATAALVIETGASDSQCPVIQSDRDLPIMAVTHAGGSPVVMDGNKLEFHPG